MTKKAGIYRGFSLVATAIVLFSPIVASAGTIPFASTFATVSLLPDPNNSSKFVQNGPANAEYSVGVNNSYSPYPFSLTASTTGDTTHGIAHAYAAEITSLSDYVQLSATANSWLKIYFEIHSATSVAVNVNVQSYLSYHAGGNSLYSGAGADVGIYSDAFDTLEDQLRLVCATTNTGTTPCSDFGALYGTSNFRLSTNTLYYMVIQASAGAQNKSGFEPNVGSAALDAYATASLSIDPNQAGAASDSLEVSEGFLNAPISPVPEPSAWTMMALGFAVVGFAMRRHQAGGPLITNH